MRDKVLTVTGPDGQQVALPITLVHTLVIGSGAAGLNAAVQLHSGGAEDLLIVTEGLQMGTSINTGSDKQTYYKLSLCGDDADAPRTMAETYFSGGGMHGDLALVEASLSVRAFVNLVNLGVPFPRDAFGQFIGYKTDHDPRQRATSIGPYTSREMCRALIRQVQRLEEMGKWLGQYGTSIYATRGGPFKPSEWGASTHRDNRIYVHVLNWPGERLVLPPITVKILGSSLLTGGEVAVDQSDKGVTITVPGPDRQAIDTIVVLELDGPARQVTPVGKKDH